MNDTDKTDRIVLTPAQMKQIARYEITFKEIIADSTFEDIDIVCPEVYAFTLEDLTEAIRNLQKADPTIYNFGEYWYYPITQLEQAFDMDRARGLLDDVDDTPEELKGYRYLPVSDSDHFDEIWYDLENAWEDWEDESHISEALNFDTILSDLDRYATNKGKPVTEWVFTKQEMKNYARSFGEDERVKKASEKELTLARKFIEDLCAMDSGMALHIKGYACYGGNRLYECDWPASRDCMIRLFEKKDNPQYANTLGYIFYYGRCTGGAPEYDKAFHYFGIAAANGLYEGMYKMADMFRHGYGCNKSLKTARALYGMVYDDSFKNFMKGQNANFADAALRMGNVYAKGIDEEEDAGKAYSYYLQADYAAKIRAKDSDFFGNTTVVINIQKAIDEIKPKLPKDYFKDYIDVGIPYIFDQLAQKNNRCLLTRSAEETGNVVLTTERLATKSCPVPENILITFAPLQLCERTTKFSMTALKPSAVWFKDDSESVRYDFCGWSTVEDRYEFYYDDELTAWIKCEKYRITAPESIKPHGQKYTLASIRFNANGRSYDYLCDIEGVQAGDTVVVRGYDGETEVTVVNVYTKYESELSIPIERFKKVLRKI